MADSIKEYSREFHQSDTFWSLTFESLRDAYFVRLCRVYDTHAKSLNLVNFLDTIKENRALFKSEQFRERQSGNAFVDSLAELDRVPSKKDIDADICLVSIKNPVVDKLLKWRHNVYAHRWSAVSLGKDAVLKGSLLSKDDIEKLLDQSFEIYNKYSSLYRATTYSRQIFGHDDYKSLLKLLRFASEKHDEEYEKEIAAIRKYEQDVEKAKD